MIIVKLWIPCYPAWLTSKNLSFYLAIRIVGDRAMDEDGMMTSRLS
jgi:hypothetical protein